MEGEIDLSLVETTSDLAGALSPLLPQLPLLLPQRAIDALMLAAQDLPAVAAGFELRLTTDVESVDLFLRATNTDGGRPILAGRHRSNILSPRLRALATWGRVEYFCRLWEESNQRVGNVSSFWCELDSVNGNIHVDTPSIFFGFSKETNVGVRSTIDAAASNLRMLAEMELSTQVLKGLLHCLDAFPPGVNAYQFGSMQSRRSNGIRICTSGWNSRTLNAFLCALDYRGEHSVLLKIWERLSARCGSLGFAFELSPAMNKVVGLECYPKPGVSTRQGWGEILDYLVSYNLCNRASADALLHWPGVIVQRELSRCQEWPHSLLLAERLLRGTRRSVLVKILSHVKISFDGYDQREAKAYFGFQYVWV